MEITELITELSKKEWYQAIKDKFAVEVSFDYWTTQNWPNVWVDPLIKEFNESLKKGYHSDMNARFFHLYACPEKELWSLDVGRVGNTTHLIICDKSKRSEDCFGQITLNGFKV